MRRVITYSNLVLGNIIPDSFDKLSDRKPFFMEIYILHKAILMI